jgi:hypothetical protein
MEEKGSSKEKLIQNINITNKVRNYSLSRDQIIEKSLEEKLLCCCINYDLTISEYKCFIELKKKVIPPYDETNEDHELCLQSLLLKTKQILSNDKDKNKESSDLKSNATISSNITSKNTINSEEDTAIWRKIGFQTGNPRTDFRAGGIFSLDLMNYFSNKHENKYKAIINEDYFTFALVCIRLSYLIRIYLFLLSSEEIKINLKFQKNIIATRKELKIFCYFLFDNYNLLLDIVSVGIDFVYQKFIEQKKAGYKEVNYFIIDPIILSAVQGLKNTLNNVNLADDFINELKRNYRENFLSNLK